MKIGPTKNTPAAARDRKGLRFSSAIDSFLYMPFDLAFRNFTENIVPKLDSAFTERVLGPPAENYKGYVEADLTQRARLVPSHRLYLLHGLADLTAPYTHGVAFAKALSEAGIIFRYQVRDTTKNDGAPYFADALVYPNYRFLSLETELRGRRSRPGGCDRTRLSFHGGLPRRVPRLGCLLVPQAEKSFVVSSASISDTS